MILYIIADEVLISFINANERIKAIQVGDLVIKLVIFFYDTTILLRDITCLDSIQVILKLYEYASSSKITFKKVESLQNFHQNTLS